MQQQHGGAIRHGSMPGTNAGGTGRPPSEVRRVAREMYFERLPVLARVADGAVSVPLREQCPACGYEHPDPDGARAEAIKRSASPGEQVRAMEALARVGMGPPVTVEDVKLRLIQQVRAMREFWKERGYEPAALEALLDVQHAIWR